MGCIYIWVHQRQRPSRASVCAETVHWLCSEWWRLCCDVTRGKMADINLSGLQAIKRATGYAFALWANCKNSLLCAYFSYYCFLFVKKKAFHQGGALWFFTTQEILQRRTLALCKAVQMQILDMQQMWPWFNIHSSWSRAKLLQEKERRATRGKGWNASDWKLSWV